MKVKTPKTKKKLSLENFLATYDMNTLRGALLSFEASTGWEVMKAYSETTQRRYEVDALDMVAKGETYQSAYASGYARALEEMREKFVEGLHQTILGKSEYIENPRPEEE